MVDQNPAVKLSDSGKLAELRQTKLEPNMNAERSKGWIIITAIAIIAAYLFLHRVGNSDLFWQIKTGELIASSLSIPSQDTFSYTMTGAAWSNPDWLSCLLFYGADRIGGAIGLSIISFAIGIALVSIITRTNLSLSKSISASIIISFIALYACGQRIQLLRPDLLGILCFASLISILATTERFTSRRALLIIPIQIVWVNLHASAILGPAIAALFISNEIFQRWGDRPSRRKLLILICLSFGAMICNPYGIESFIYPFRILTDSYVTSVTTDWWAASWSFPRADVIAWLWTALATAMIYLGIKRRKLIRWPLAIAAVASIPCALFMARFMPYSIITIAICIASLIADNNQGDLSMRRSIFAIALIASLSIGCIPPIYDLRWNGTKLLFGLGRGIGVGIDRDLIPVDAVDYIANSEITGNIFNDMAYGGYLTYRLMPTHRIFIDTRTPVFGPQFLRDYLHALKDENALEEMVARYDIRCIIFDSYHIEAGGYLSFLKNNPKWNLAFESPQADVFVRR